MRKSNRLLDQLERSQRHKTQERRENRLQRRNVVVVAGLFLVACLGLGLPSLISHSSLAHGMLARTAADYDFDATAGSIRIGWMTPLRLKDVKLVGRQAGSELHIDQLDVNVTALDLLKSSTNDLGDVVVRGLHIALDLRSGRSSLEDDLQAFLRAPSDGSSTTGAIHLQDVTVDATDSDSGKTWRLDPSNADIELKPDAVVATFSGAIRDPSGSGGSVEGRIDLASEPDGSLDGSTDINWQADLQFEFMPLSIASFVSKRFQDTANSIPTDVSGDLSGQIEITGYTDGATEVAIHDGVIRHFNATRLVALTDVDLTKNGARSPQRGTVKQKPKTVKQTWYNELASIDGKLLLLGDRIVGRQLHLVSDFASMTFDGVMANSMTLAGETDNPLTWLNRIDGEVDIKVDLARLNRSLPGLLPLREDAELISGSVHAHVESVGETDRRRSRLTVQTEPLKARAGNRSVTIDSLRLTAIVVEDHGQLRAETFECRSAFASAKGQGDLRSGSADIDIDFERLTATLSPLINLSGTSLQGVVAGRIRWNVDRNNRWRLSGDGRANQIAVSFADGRGLRRELMEAKIDAVGIWGGNSLEELTTANVALSSDGMNLTAQLIGAVNSPSRLKPLPIRIQGNGPIRRLIDMLRPWLPASVQQSNGSFDIDAHVEISATTARLTSLEIETQNARIEVANRSFEQLQRLRLLFDGDYGLPSGDLKIRNATLQGQSISAAMTGDWVGDHVDLQMHWRADLERLQGVIKPAVTAQRATRSTPAFRQVSYQTSRPDQQWFLTGRCEGRIGLTSRGTILDIQTHATGTNVTLLQPADASSSGQMGPRRPLQYGLTDQTNRGSSLPASRSPTSRSTESQRRVTWYEPNIDVDGLFSFDRSTGRVRVDNAQLSSDWFATKLNGQAIWNETDHDIRLRGPTTLKMDQVAGLLASVTGMDIQAAGLHQSPIDIRVGMAKTGGVAFDIVGELGWEQAVVAGVELSESVVPFRMTEATVSIDQTIVPVGAGRINLAGQVHYQADPLWVQLEPGVIAESVRVTPEMADRWLKFLAPVIADAATVDGTFSCEIKEGFFVIDDPNQSRVIGRLDIESVQMLSGPMTTSIISGLDQLRGLASLGGQGQRDRRNTKLVSLPPQQVEFQLSQGVVNHQRLLMEIDQAQVFTSGRVALDGRLDMVAQVPLSDRWLGSDLKSLSGNVLRFPIQGTISDPQIDSRDLARFGTQAIQSAALGYLQDEITGGRGKLNEQINRGIDSLGLGPIFGR